MLSHLVHEFYSRPVKYSVFGIVSHTVADHQLKVGSYVIHCSVCLQIHLPTHRCKVHGILDQISVIRNLTIITMSRTVTMTTANTYRTWQQFFCASSFNLAAEKDWQQFFCASSFNLAAEKNFSIKKFILSISFGASFHTRHSSVALC